MFTADMMSQLPEDLPEEVFARLDGKRSPEIESAVNAWLSKSGNADVLAELENVWKLTRPPVGADGWDALNRRLDELERRRAVPITSARSHATRAWLRVAAVLLVGVGMGTLWPRLQASLDPIEQTRIVVPPGSQTEVELPGGVKVLLNYASELAYVPSGNVREVDLKGEAYISVPGGADDNVIVNTEAGVVRDLGTQFNVRARDGMTSVVVTEGSVELGTERGKVRLMAGQESSVYVGGTPSSPNTVNPDQALGWMSRRSTFYDQPVGQVAKELQYRYGVIFEVDPQIRSTRITAKISAQASAADAAEVICIAVQARCTSNGNRWVISPR